jgi:5-methyltetrahydrofolate--homocysteine methyltransferase
MRHQPTDAERLLWQALRRRQLDGFRFRRQHPIGWYIADFFCWETGVVVEVGGGVHTTPDQAARDHERDIALQRMGYQIIRIANKEVEDDLGVVLARIHAACVNALSPSTDEKSQ